MNEFLTEIAARLGDCCATVAAGDDVPPATVHRLEGAIETGIRHGLASREEVERLLEGLDRVAALGADVTRLQFAMNTAPVYPSAPED